MFRGVHAWRSIAWLLLLGLHACASVSTQCRQQMEDCIRRCEKVDPDMRPAPTSSPPTTTLTDCEAHCSCGSASSTTPKPTGTPTPTGTTP